MANFTRPPGGPNQPPTNFGGFGGTGPGNPGGGFNPIGMLPPHATAGAFTHLDTLAAAGAVAAADAYAVEAALPIRHRAGSAWFMNRSVIRVFQALEVQALHEVLREQRLRRQTRNLWHSLQLR
jgi:hypothetical protein